MSLTGWPIQFIGRHYAFPSREGRKRLAMLVNHTNVPSFPVVAAVSLHKFSAIWGSLCSCIEGSQVCTDLLTNSCLQLVHVAHCKLRRWATSRIDTKAHCVPLTLCQPYIPLHAALCVETLFLTPASQDWHVLLVSVCLIKEAVCEVFFHKKRNILWTPKGFCIPASLKSQGNIKEMFYFLKFHSKPWF